MKQIIDDFPSLLERRDRAASVILKAKGLDGRKKDANGNIITVNNVGAEQNKLSCEFDRERERIIYELERLNAVPDVIPGDFISRQSLIEQYCPDEKYIEVDGMHVLENPDFNKYLTPGIIDTLTKRWFTDNRIEEKDGVDFYYNSTFLWNVLEFQRGIIQNEELNKVDFLIDACDRPLIYQYHPNQPTGNSETLTDEWNYIKRKYDIQLEELSLEVDEADRGDFWVDLDKPVGELYQEGDHIIYEIASRRFWTYVDCLYRLSEWHPEYFGSGPSKIMDGLFEHFKIELYGEDKKISCEEFKLKASREFLYLSNEEKQLRLDLYRQIDPPREDKDEVFTGGLFHIFDHFKGLRASLNNRGDYIYDEEVVLSILKDMFFNYATYHSDTTSGDQKYIANNIYETLKSVNEHGEGVIREKNWKCVFFLNVSQKLYYLTSLHISR